MDFAFSEEQTMIADTAEAFLAEHCTIADTRAVMLTEQGYDNDRWQQLCEMYWHATHIPDAYDGLGLGYVEIAILLEKMGQNLLCSPFFSTVALGANALRIAGSEAQQAHWFEQIIAGRTATLAYTGAGAGWGADAVTLDCQPDGTDWVLNGKLRYVPDGHTADIVVVAARAPGSKGIEGISLFVIASDTAGVSRRWLPTMDQTRRQAELVFDKVRVSADAVLAEPGDAWPALSKVLDLAAIGVAADLLGVAQQSLDITLAYTEERQQFGRSIASFQSVKHKAADMMLKAEAARSAVYYAACIADEALNGSPMASQLPEAASIAKAYCSEAAFFNAGCGIQLHGGVGFTAEYDIQLYFKRAKSGETLLGDASFHRARLADQILAGDIA